MQPTPALQLSTAVNWSIAGQLIDQFPAAVVVINSLPFRGRIDRLPPSPPHWLPRVPTPTARSRSAAVGYAVAEPVESITRLKRHELTSGKLRVLPIGGTDVLHQ
jgi:hypothetical protein